MPFLGAIIFKFIDVLTLVDLTTGAVGGYIGSWCREHLGLGYTKHSTIDIGNRDIIDISDIPKLNVKRQAVGPCNIPMYNFDLCQSD